MIIADTSVWIAYQRDPASEIGSEFESLLITGSIAMVGPVMAEILHGCRSDVEYDFYVGRLDGPQFLDTDQETWVLVGELGYRLRRHGVTVPFSDLVISALAIQNGLPVYTLDEDFQRIPGLELYEPAQ
jgi:predicted nucleic acid-binding protein